MMAENTERDLNYESFKKRNEEYEKSTRRLLKNIIKLAPREMVIKVLKELKIIKTDINPKTDKLELQESDRLGKERDELTLNDANEVKNVK